MENQNVAPRTNWRDRVATEEKEETVFKKVKRVFVSAVILALISGILYLAVGVLPNTLPYWAITHKDQVVHVLYTLQQVNKSQGDQGLNKVLAAYNK